MAKEKVKAAFKRAESYGALLKRITAALTSESDKVKENLPLMVENLIVEYSGEETFRAALKVTLDEMADQTPFSVFLETLERAAFLTRQHPDLHIEILEMCVEQGEGLYIGEVKGAEMINAAKFLTIPINYALPESQISREATDDLSQLADSMTSIQGERSAAMTLWNLARRMEEGSNARLCLEAKIHEMRQPDMTPDRFLSIFRNPSRDDEEEAMRIARRSGDGDEDAPEPE